MISMSQDNDCIDTYFAIRIGIDKLLRSIDKSTLKEIKNILRDNNLELKDFYDRPDILCKILREIYGRSYTRIIEDI